MREARLKYFLGLFPKKFSGEIQELISFQDVPVPSLQLDQFVIREDEGDKAEMDYPTPLCSFPLWPSPNLSSDWVLKKVGEI